MNTETFNLELITPCFCAGANQSIAEIRAPSIRGQLRWWFRVLGGNAKDEALLFGSAAGDLGTGSRLRLSVSDVKPAADRNVPAFSPNDAQSYVWHYARVSGTTIRGASGPRWQAQGAMPAGTRFKVHLNWLRPAGSLKPAFDEALFAFLALGAVGLRATRGLGAFHCEQVAGDLDSVISYLGKKSFTIRRRSNPDDFTDYASALRDWAAWLRYRLREEHKAERPSPLGSTDPRRQTSAIRFRPFRTHNGRISWLAFEAPGSRVLGTESRRNSPLLSGYSFSGPAPAPARKARRY